MSDKFLSALVAMAAIMSATGRAADGTGVLRRLDHLVYAVPDLDAGVADLQRALPRCKVSR